MATEKPKRPAPGLARKTLDAVSQGALTVKKGVYGALEPARGSVNKVILAAIIGFIATVALLSKGFRTDTPQGRYFAIERVDAASGDTCEYVLEAVLIDTLGTEVDCTPQTNVHKVPDEEVFFNRYPLFLIWVLLVSVMVGFSVACLPIFIKFYIWLRGQFPEAARRQDPVEQSPTGTSEQPRFRNELARREHFLLVLALGCVLFLTPLLLDGLWTSSEVVGQLDIVFRGRYVLLLPFAATVACAMAGALALFALGSGVRQLKMPAVPKKDATTGTFIDSEVNDTRMSMLCIQHQYTRLTELLRSCLVLLAAMVAFSVATSGTLREAMLSIYQVEHLHVFPMEFVHAFGLFYTAFLGAIYLPQQYLLSAKGKQLARDVQLIEGELDPATLQGQGTTTTFADEASGWDSLTKALTIFGPFLASFLPDLMKVFTGE